MAFHSFLRRASSSIIPLSMRSLRSVRPYQGAFSVPDVENRCLGRVVGGQFPTFVRLLTGPVHETALQNEAAEETSTKFSPVEKVSLPKEAAEKTFTKSTDDGLDGLPFEIKDGGPEERYLTLIRKYRDEIIEIKVRPCYEKNWGYIDTDSDSDEVEEAEETDSYDLVAETLKLLGDDEEEAKDKIKIEDGDIRCLNVLAKIYYGDEFKECLKFFLVAYPDKIVVRSMSRRVEKGTKHLQDYEEFFKQRLIQPSTQLNINLGENINFLFDFLNVINNQKNQIDILQNVAAPNGRAGNH